MKMLYSIDEIATPTSYFSSESPSFCQLYFNAPVCMLGDDIPEDAVLADLRIEIGSNLTKVYISPIHFDRDEDAYVSYDWREYNLPDDIVNKLIDKGLNQFEKNN